MPQTKKKTAAKKDDGSKAIKKFFSDIKRTNQRSNDTRKAKRAAVKGKSVKGGR